ncbi:MAG: hypothetical protein VW299_01570 [Alphaproteobacteria bacterium]
MNVTQEILNNHIIYGASDYTAPSSLVAGKSLNYADGPSIQRPAHRELSTVPFTFNFQSDVGLFGVENYFTKIQLKIIGDKVFACFEEEGWECAAIGLRDTEEIFWDLAVVDLDTSCTTQNTYECPIIKANELPDVGANGYFSVEIINNKTNNIYNDDWVDVRLYSKTREEHGYERMWVKPKDFFYVGIHARNTRRLPFDVSCVVGLQYADFDSIPDKREIMKR